MKCIEKKKNLFLFEMHSDDHYAALKTLTLESVITLGYKMTKTLH
jgi:hypothetical protein